MAGTTTPSSYNLGNNNNSLNMVTRLLGNLVTRDIVEASSMAEVVVVPGDVVAVAEVGHQQVRSFVTGAVKQVTSPLSVQKPWQV